jgi:hypothetical protein
MTRFPAPFDFYRPTLMMGQMMFESQIVISLRLMGMAGMLPAAQGENARMVSEKTSALQEAGLAASRAFLTGAAMPAIALAAITPVRRRTRANVRRLMKPARSRT